MLFGKKFDAITIGGAKLDIFLTLNEKNSKVSFDAKKHELCFAHGEKIEVEKTQFCVGGNAANVAVGLARLGIKTAVVAEIGDDEFAQKIVNSLKKEGVDETFLHQIKSQESSISVAINYKGDRTLLTEHAKRKHNFAFDSAKTNWIYLTSLGQEWVHAYERLLSYIERKKPFLAFNPGTMQLDEKYSLIEKIIKITDILFVNKEEAETLVRSYADSQVPKEIEHLLEATQSLGAKIVVITDGENGSYAIDQQKNHYHQTNFKTTIVERTGAGDGYATGFLAGTIHNLSVQQAMRWGAANAASVITRVGAEAGLLLLKEMEAKVHES